MSPYRRSFPKTGNRPRVDQPRLFTIRARSRAATRAGLVQTGDDCLAAFGHVERRTVQKQQPDGNHRHGEPPIPPATRNARWLRHYPNRKDINRPLRCAQGIGKGSLCQEKNSAWMAAASGTIQALVAITAEEEGTKRLRFANIRAVQTFRKQIKLDICPHILHREGSCTGSNFRVSFRSDRCDGLYCPTTRQPCAERLRASSSLGNRTG